MTGLETFDMLKTALSVCQYFSADKHEIWLANIAYLCLM